jgi:hypothetical protein
MRHSRSEGSRPARTSRYCRRLRLEALEDRTLLSANPIVAENLLPGTPQSVWGVSGGGDPSILGFATDVSVNHGQTISFKIDDYANAPYHIDIYRLGYYQGNGARLVTTLSQSQVLQQVQPAPLTDNATGLVDAGNWSVSASWAVPAAAVSGIYVARLTRNDTGGASLIYFVVRADESTSDLLFQTSDSTWQAYNNWDGTGNGKAFFSPGGVYGGVSFYTYNGNNPTLSAYGRATAVSYNRPLVDDATVGGFGSYDSPMHAEYPMLRWLEMNGYDVTYTTDVDSARNGNLMLNHAVFMSVGHDEYWSAEQRNNVQAAVNAGVNVAFFSGNEAFWKTRWQASLDSSAAAYRTLVCYKQSYPNAPHDPLDGSPNWVWTGTWRDVNGGLPADGDRPENALTGTMYMTDRTNVDLGIPMTVPAADASLRFWRNTSVASLQPGQVATLGQFVVGYETDADVDNGFRPAGLFDLSATTFNTASVVQNQAGTIVGAGASTQQNTLYRAPSGALVFGAGTVQWSWGLDGHHNDTPSTPDAAIQQATVNLLADMDAQPGTLQAGLVPATASADVIPPTSVITSPVAGANLTVGSTLTISGAATDAGGGVVAVVEVSVDGGLTWRRAVLGGAAAGTVNWSYSWVPATPGPIVLKSRATDDSANVEIPSAGVTVNVSYQATNTVGLVAAYSFNEGSGATVADASGHGNAGTISGATWTTGLFGNALAFNGTNSWVTINDASSLHLTTGMTLEAWVKPTAAAANWTAVMIKERPSGLAYGLYAADGADQPPAGYIDTSNTDNDSKGRSALAVNTWSFLSVTYDGSNLDLYVNGALVNALPVSGSIVSSTGALRIGGDSIWGEYFQGLIDNVRIYNRALNVGEISSDMSTPVGGSLETTAPTGSLSGPSNGATVSGVTTVSASASDNVLVAGVQFLLDGAPLGQAVTTAPYSLAWDTRKSTNGSHTLSAVVNDAAGNTTTLSSVTVTVNNAADAVPPAVKLMSPTGGSVRGVIVPWAVATDNVEVGNVQFQLNGVNIGPADVSTPYRMAWNTSSVADGTYRLTAVATDLAGNVTTSSPVSVTVDNTPPRVTSVTPAQGGTGVSTGAPNLSAVFNEAVQPGTITVILKDAAGHSVSVDATYNSSTNTVAIDPAGALEPATTYTATVSGAQDLAGNTMSAVIWSFTTTSTVTNATIWQPTDTPTTASAPDNNPQELGVKFTSDVAGYVTGIRFYKGPSNTGTHVGHLWTSGGTLLASATFTGETATGWQQVNFSTPVAIQAGVTYVASYLDPSGNYAYDGAYFASSGVDAGVLHALPNSAGGNGVFGTAGTMPASSFNAANYWVDVVFSNVLVPAIVSTTPTANATGVSTTAPLITATFSKPVTAGTISFALADAGNHPVAATLTYNPATNTATLTPSTALAASTTFTATVSGAQDSSGQTITPYSWSFTTAAPDTTPPTVIARTPAAGATLASATAPVTATFSKPVTAGTISFALADAGNHPVAATLTYNPATNTATLTPSAHLSPNTTYTATLSGAQDLAGNGMSVTTWSFTTAPQISNATIWTTSATPAVTAANDSGPQELGVKFTSDTDGFITGLRFYKGAGNGGTHVGHLWTASGALLATATFSGETASGWQQVSFSSPVAVQAGVTYVASYFAPQGHYAYTGAYFASAGADSGVLHALSGPAAGGNGVFVATPSGAFPNQSFNSANYWVDVLFSTTLTPVVTATTPAAGAAGASINPVITATFSGPIDVSTLTSSTFYLRAVGSSTNAAATISYSGTTATLHPSAALALGTTYQVTLSGTVATPDGHSLGSDFTWSFTTQLNPTFTDTTTVDFGSGTPDANTAIVQMGDGEVILKPTMDAEFSGSSFPADWSVTSLGAGSLGLVSGGQATLDGVRAGTTGLYSVGQGRSLEFTATFSGDAYQHAGFGVDFNSAPWATFSTGSGGALYARTSSGSSSIDTLLSGNWLGSPHDFRIDWLPTVVNYWIDGTLVATHNVAITANMRPLADDNNVGGGTLSVDWMRLTPYSSSGSYLSRVFDAGQVATWLDAQWAATLPSGASLAVSVRMGNSPTPDATWTDFVPLATSGATLGGASRYAQYRVDLATTAMGQTPVLQALSLEYSLASGADVFAPRITSETPAANATGVGLLAPVVIKFSELLNAASVGSSSVYLRAQGSSTNADVTITVSGSTVTLTPNVALLGSTAYVVTVTGAVQDASGNALNGLSWTFTTGAGTWTQTSASDFAAGTTSGTTVTSASGGEVQAAPSFQDDFAGSSLSSAWTHTSWASQGGAPESITVSGGLLSLSGTQILSAQTYQNVPVQGLVSFAASAYQHFGLGTDTSSFNGNYWALFSTGSTPDHLFAKVNVNGATQEVDLGALPGGFHLYEVKPTASAFEFYVDGALKTTITATFPSGAQPRILMSSFGSSALQVDWVRVLNYASSSTFVSSVFDVTRTATWGVASWDATLPPGTSILVETSSSTDGTNWSSWASVSNGGTVASPAGRYLRYRVTFVTSDPSVTAVFSDVSFLWT